MPPKPVHWLEPERFCNNDFEASEPVPGTLWRPWVYILDYFVVLVFGPGKRSLGPESGSLARFPDPETRTTWTQKKIVPGRVLLCQVFGSQKVDPGVSSHAAFRRLSSNRDIVSGVNVRPVRFFPPVERKIVKPHSEFSSQLAREL